MTDLTLSSATEFNDLHPQGAKSTRAIELFLEEKLGGRVRHYATISPVPSKQLKNKLGQAHDLYGGLLVLSVASEDVHDKAVIALRERWAEQGWDTSPSCVGVCYKTPAGWRIRTLVEWRKSLFAAALRERLFPEIAVVQANGSEFYRAASRSAASVDLSAGDVGEDLFTPPPAYDLDAMALETGISRDVLVSWKRALDRKGQVILYGPPGTGKSFLAERLAKAVVGGGRGFHSLVQLHPGYDYADFVQGIRPATAAGALTYELTDGRLLDVCRAASRVDGEPCVLVIDEINRANLPRVLGELMYLLEYRDRSIELASGEKFEFPSNVFLIGTMNTADRSVALVDYALRRRFAFLKLRPDYELLSRFHQQNRTGFDPAGLVAVLDRLNTAISEDAYLIGHSYFMRQELRDELAEIWASEIEPYLEEFFFDRPEVLEGFRWASVRSEASLGGSTST